MIINYNVSGSERKRLVTAIALHTGEKPKYLGAPSFTYQVGGFSISVDGKVTVADNSTAAPLIRFLREHNFQAEDPIESCTEDASVEEQTVENKSGGVRITMPLSYFADSAIENIRAIVVAKGSLIKKALDVDELPLEITKTSVCFPWFRGNPTPEEFKAYETFICKLCEMARTQKRVNAKEKEADNEKYAFRCFLLRLGFIGDEYKMERKILLRNLSGSSAFKNDQAREVKTCES